HDETRHDSRPARHDSTRASTARDWTPAVISSSRPMTDARRGLPSVTSLLESEGIKSLLDHAPRGVVVDAIRRTIASVRSSHEDPPGDADAWAAAVANAVDDATRRSLRRVINATGVVLHTNLGRAPLAGVALDAIDRVARGFSNLE